MSNKSRANKRNQGQQSSPHSDAPPTDDVPAFTDGEAVSETEPAPRPYVDLDTIYTVATEAGDGMMKLAASDVRHMVEAIIILAAQKQAISRAVEVAEAEALSGLNLEAIAKLVAQGSRPPE